MKWWDWMQSFGADFQPFQSYNCFSFKENYYANCTCGSGLCCEVDLSSLQAELVSLPAFSSSPGVLPQVGFEPGEHSTFVSTVPNTVLLRTSSPFVHVSSLWTPFDGGKRSGYLVFIREFVVSFLPSTKILPRSQSLHSREEWVRIQSRKYLEEKNSWEIETPAHLHFYSQLKDSTWHIKINRNF